MKDEDIQNLLGGFATDTLTDREREMLFTAALKNQGLFNALADEQALRELLSDPASRRQLLDALQPQETGFFAWMRRPAFWGAVAVSAMTALLVAVALRQAHPPVQQVAQTMSRPQPAEEKAVGPQAAPQPATPPARME